MLELLVVISIIAILAASLMVTFGSVRARARDVERELEIKTLQHALELYFVSFRAYPISTGPTELTRSDPISLALSGSGTINQVPLDPINDAAYHYIYNI